MPIEIVERSSPAGRWMLRLVSNPARLRWALIVAGAFVLLLVGLVGIATSFLSHASPRLWALIGGGVLALLLAVRLILWAVRFSVVAASKTVAFARDTGTRGVTTWRRT